MKSRWCFLFVVFAAFVSLTASRSLSHYASVRQSDSNNNNTTTDNSNINSANEQPADLSAAPPPSNNTDPFAKRTPKQVDKCEKPETYGKFKVENCGKLAILIEKSVRTEKQTFEVRNAMLILLYFAGLTFIMFSLITIVRIHAMGSRSKYTIRACRIFSVCLLFVAILMPVIRALLKPFDAEVLGVNNENLNRIIGCCVKKIDWPLVNPNSESRAPLSGDPFLGQPPRNYWPFWLVVAASFATAITLAATLVYLRYEETRGVWQGKQVFVDRSNHGAEVEQDIEEHGHQHVLEHEHEREVYNTTTATER